VPTGSSGSNRTYWVRQEIRAVPDGKANSRCSRSRIGTLTGADGATGPQGPKAITGALDRKTNGNEMVQLVQTVQAGDRTEIGRAPTGCKLGARMELEVVLMEHKESWLATRTVYDGIEMALERWILVKKETKVIQCHRSNGYAGTIRN